MDLERHVHVLRVQLLMGRGGKRCRRRERSSWVRPGPHQTRGHHYGAGVEVGSRDSVFIKTWWSRSLVIIIITVIIIILLRIITVAIIVVIIIIIAIFLVVFLGVYLSRKHVLNPVLQVPGRG